MASQVDHWTVSPRRMAPSAIASTMRAFPAKLYPDEGEKLCRDVEKLCPDETHPEVRIEADWASNLDGTPPTTKTRPLVHEPARKHYGENLVMIEGLLTKMECERINAAAESVGFGKTSYPQDYRGNLRLTTIDPGLATALWARVQRVAPATVEARGLDGEWGVWRAIGLNECFRFAKYKEGHRFGAHTDANFARAGEQEMSLFTVNIYTNTVAIENGGKTRFFTEVEKDRQRARAHADRHADLLVQPEAGLAALFLQNPQPEAPLHDGEMLLGGVKYLLRTDVMYRREAPLATAQPAEADFF